MLRDARADRPLRDDGELCLGDTVLIGRVQRATGLRERMRGLLGRRGLAPGEGMWLDPCTSIHMVGMTFPIDVIFLDTELHVIRVVSGVRPMWCARGGRGTRSAVEVASGWLPAARLQPGTPLVYRPA